MSLMTPELEKRFAEIGSQDDVDDPIIVAKFYSPLSSVIWYATEYDPVAEMFYGFVSRFDGKFQDWEHFSLEELETHICSHCLEPNQYYERVGQDPLWTERKASTVIR